MQRPTLAVAALALAVALNAVVVRVAAAGPNTSDHLFNTTKELQASNGQPSRYCAPCEKPCGKSEFVSTHIINGANANENEFGWVAVLGSFRCGGTLITKKHVLTAAHCIEYLSLNHLTVTIGEHDRTVETGRKTVHRVAKIHKHPDFQLSTMDNDIAVIELRDTVDIDKPWIQIACLPKSASVSYAGIMGTVVGWGQVNENKSGSDILQKVNVPIISNDECKKMSHPPETITSNMICAGYKDGQKDACKGDSGGPLHRYFNITRNHSIILEVIGIVSWGAKCAIPNYPGVYTRVANYLDWIMDHTGDECICKDESF